MHKLCRTQQHIPENAENAHITKLPHTDMSRSAGDKYRIGLMSDLAKKLFDEYDIVIGCDCDEFLIVDPALNTNLADYLSQLQKLTHQNLDILKTINESFFTKQNHLQVAVGDANYVIPSFISLENKINILEENFNNLIHFNISILSNRYNNI